MCWCELQVANEQAQRLEAAAAAEERIQVLEQRLASQQDAALAHQAAAAGEPPAMAAPGACPSLHPLINPLPPPRLVLPCLNLQGFHAQAAAPPPRSLSWASSQATA